MKKIAFILISSLLIWTSCSEDENGFGFDSRNVPISSEISDGNRDNGITGTQITEGEGEVQTGGELEVVENDFVETEDEAISTFSIDADGASYSLTRRYLNRNLLPEAWSIRTEEFINYFNYDYPDPEGAHPIGLEGEISTCPWATDHQLVRIGIKGKDIVRQQYPPSNLVFLIDASGSMSSPDKIELLKDGFKLLVDELRPQDRISLVTYASNPRVVLPSVSGDNKNQIKDAIDRLSASGSTNGEGGILTAYDIAEANFIEGGNNRIIMASDGDFNVGISSQEELIDLIEVQREKDIFLTILGVGSSLHSQGTMEQLANNGNGNYEYLDNLDQCNKVFIDEYNKFFAVAKDVKVQVEFNEELVKAYRLIGYENRLLNIEDFEDDTKDAGEIGAGQCITALYEIIPQKNGDRSSSAFTIDFRYKFPTADVSIPISLDIFDQGNSFVQATDNHRFATAVAAYGLELRDSKYKGDVDFSKILNWATESSAYDPFGYKAEFTDLVNKASGL